MKSEVILFDLRISLMITLRLYFLGILESQGTPNFVSLRRIDVIKIPFWISKLVSKNFFGHQLCSDGNYLSHRTKDLLDSFYDN